MDNRGKIDSGIKLAKICSILCCGSFGATCAEALNAYLTKRHQVDVWEQGRVGGIYHPSAAYTATETALESERNSHLVLGGIYTLTGV